jgi:predicted hydrocarbon binding protein
MERIPKSGYYNSNKFARIFLESITEITGRNGLNSILNYASLDELIDDLPPDNLDLSFDFAHFSSINQALTEIYGDRGGKGISLRIGKITFSDVLKDYGAIAGVTDIAFKILPIQSKIKFGLRAMARVFSEKSDQISIVIEEEDYFRYQIERCPVCWGRKEQTSPVCYYMVGLLQEGLYWVSGGKEFQIKETKCIAMSNSICEFQIQKTHLD